MIQLELTNEEEQDLREEVEKRLTELDHEIAHTDSVDFKKMLKRRRQSVQKLLEKLPDIGGFPAGAGAFRPDDPAPAGLN